MLLYLRLKILLRSDTHTFMTFFRNSTSYSETQKSYLTCVLTKVTEAQST